MLPTTDIHRIMIESHILRVYLEFNSDLKMGPDLNDEAWLEQRRLHQPWRHPIWLEEMTPGMTPEARSSRFMKYKERNNMLRTDVLRFLRVLHNAENAEKTDCASQRCTKDKNPETFTPPSQH
jgi:hypothetical protein